MVSVFKVSYIPTVTATDTKRKYTMGHQSITGHHVHTFTPSGMTKSEDFFKLITLQLHKPKLVKILTN